MLIRSTLTLAAIVTSPVWACGSTETSREVGSAPSSTSTSTSGTKPAPQPAGVAGRHPDAGGASDASRASSSMLVTFKLDIGGTYGGARWLPPPFKTGLLPVESAGVDARAQGLDEEGRTFHVVPTWTASDPDMVVVSPVQSGDTALVHIAVRSTGESRLLVTSQVGAIDLRVRATNGTPSGMQIEIDR